ncbi:hypothetical protein GALMADRAFT_252325 [Galerina marginata CBS 339.88]|uniref:Uncharacterized protein n=1 Tax=Galerina marginata (strain CBS 339.88) TaxID=685588 RepID=A0A067SSH2_GALM3|nr:hypothetical protein GALMADRAFT_252325 [Galerina marginata CBS 339.88]
MEVVAACLVTHRVVLDTTIACGCSSPVPEEAASADPRAFTSCLTFSLGPYF